MRVSRATWERYKESDGQEYGHQHYWVLDFVESNIFGKDLIHLLHSDECSDGECTTSDEEAEVEDEQAFLDLEGLVSSEEDDEEDEPEACPYCGDTGHDGSACIWRYGECRVCGQPADHWHREE